MTVYTEEQMREIEADPERLRAYFWQVAQRCRLMAAEGRERRRKGFWDEDGPLHPASLENLSEMILEHMDTLVKWTRRP